MRAACCPRICTSTVRQHLGASGIGHGALGLGILLSWSSVAIPQLIKTQDLGQLTLDDISWITNITTLGAIISLLPTGYLVDNFGRKLTTIFFTIPFGISWILMGAASSVGVLLTGRFLGGLAGGAFSIIIPLYMTEIAETRIRAAIGFSFTQQLLTGGVFAIFASSTFGWQLLAYKCIPISIVLGVIAYFLPESPYYLFHRGENKSGLSAIKWFRISTDIPIVEEEVKMIEKRMEYITPRPLKFDKPWTIKSFLQPILVSSGLILLQSLSNGTNLILGVTSLILTIAGRNFSPGTVYLVVAIVPLVTMALTAPFADKIGRRILLMTSGGVMALSAIFLVFILYVQAGEVDGNIGDKIKWFRFGFFILYIFGFAFGVGPISWIIMGELVPDRNRGLGASIVTMFYWIPSFLIGKYFIDLLSLLTVPGYFGFLSIISIITIGYVYLFVPETRGSTMVEIQELFEYNTNTVKSPVNSV